MSKSNNDNRSNQMNPNNDAYWQSRGTDERPDYWEEEYEIIEEHQTKDVKDNRSNQLNPNHLKSK